MCSVPVDRQRSNRGFQRVVAAFLGGDGLPFASVLSAERIGRVFANRDNLFGGNTIYSTATVVWAFLAQTLRDGKEASCRAAVAGIVAWRLQRGLTPPTADTGDYCRARAKLSEAALRQLAVETAEELQQHAELYGFRWHSELDIRSIKQTLGLDHVRCKSPSMVRKELWTTLLAYNLIRTTAAAAALLHGKQPRQISFTGTCQYVLSTWMLLSTDACSDPQSLCQTMLDRIASRQVADRPGRIEPRVLKRRRHRYPLMQYPRYLLRQELHHANIPS